MGAIRHSMSNMGCVSLVALALAGVPRAAQAQYFAGGYDYGLGPGNVVSVYDVYGALPGARYGSPAELYGYVGIDLTGSAALAFGDNYTGLGWDGGFGYGYPAYDTGGAVFASPFANPILEEGQNAAGTQSRAHVRKAPRRGQARTNKRAGDGADRKAP